MKSTSQRSARLRRCFSIVVGLAACQAATARLGAQSEALYTLRFDSTWSAETHPVNFPPGPHFSGLIGGTHSSAVKFWESGQLASQGIENMAEVGSKFQLAQEVEAAILAGDAFEVISGGGIGESPGTISATFTVRETHPLATVVSMIAPSPDWFVGVSGVSLFESGEWMPELTIELHAYDAGTDSGASYTSPNADTQPPELIHLLTSGPFEGNSTPLGTFTFTLDSVVEHMMFLRGDANDDGQVDISDSIFLLNFLFVFDSLISCQASGDTNSDGAVDIADAVFLLNHLFVAGSLPPEAPYPECGFGVADADNCEMSNCT